MGNIGRIIKDDFRRLFSNVVSVVIVIGLSALPSLFVWYNVLACWDVFDNTGKLKVAVATEDAGFKGGILPVTINVGDDVISGLRGNDDIGWVFTDTEDALDGARSGRYYAAVVIPETFSEDLLTYCFGGGEQAYITYYSNEKISAIAPKITDQGADAVSSTINTVLVETVSTVLLGTVDSVWSYAQENGFDESLLALPDNLRNLTVRVDNVADTITGYATLASDTAKLAGSTATAVFSLSESLDSAEDGMDKIIASAQKTIDGSQSALEDALSNINSAFADVSGLDADSLAAIEAARAQVRSALAEYRESLAPAIADLQAALEAVRNKADGSLESLQDVCNKLGARLQTLSSDLYDTSAQLTDTVSRLHETSDTINAAADKIDEALYSENAETLRDMLSGDVEMLASALTEPVGVERVAVYPSENFGSAMSPLYATLGLFIGALLIMVIVSPRPAAATVEKLKNPKQWQLYLGHYGMVLFIATMQSLILSLGNIFFLQIQVLHPWLYILCCWVASFAFSFIIYTLVVLFANLGKAMAVLLLIMQVTGCEGSFPLALLPDFVSTLSPYLPATHVVSAMRAAMMGIYAGDFWMSLAALGIMVVPFLVLGLVLGKPASKLVGWYLRRVDASKLMN